MKSSGIALIGISLGGLGVLFITARDDTIRKSAFMAEHGITSDKVHGVGLGLLVLGVLAIIASVASGRK